MKRKLSSQFHVNVSVEGKMVHLIACGIHPTIALTVPPGWVGYNTLFNLTAICDIDEYPVTFLGTANVEFRINTSTGWQIYAVPISGNQTVTYPVWDALLYRGAHRVRVTLAINGTALAAQEDLIMIRGYASVIVVMNHSGVQARSLTIPLEDGTNASGPLRLYIYLGDEWVLLDTINSLIETFQIRPNLAARQYVMKVNGSGTLTTEPCEASFTLTLTPNYLIILLAFFGGIAAVAVPLLIVRTHQRRHTAKTQERAAILAACEKDHELKRLAAGLRIDIMGRPAEEPEVFGDEEPEVLK